ncbi:hypothetical protein MASR1M31_25360 [Porphyromonadaceae bacterium]
MNLSQKGGVYISSSRRELRNLENRLLCKADDVTGTVEAEGPHKMRYLFVIPVGGTFTVIRGGVQSLVTRTDSKFIIRDNHIVNSSYT